MVKEKKEEVLKELVRVDALIKQKVEAYLIGKKMTIGQFYDQAVSEKIKRLKTK